MHHIDQSYFHVLNLQPKFLTKEERAKLALEKRQQEVEEMRQKQEAERHQREEFDTKAMEEARSHYNGLHSLTLFENVQRIYRIILFMSFALSSRSQVTTGETAAATVKRIAGLAAIEIVTPGTDASHPRDRLRWMWMMTS